MTPPEVPFLAGLRALVPRWRRASLGVRALVRWEGRVVLVRHRLHDRGRWYLPGGAVDAREDAAAACLREVEEEAGIPRRALQLQGVLGVFVNALPRWDDHVLLFAVQASAAPAIAPLSLEIAECRAFAPGELPPLSPATSRRLQEAEAGPQALCTGAW